MTTQFSAVEPLQVPAANFTGDPLQVTQAFSGLIGRLSAWAQKVSALLNRLSPGGGAVPVSQGGTGDVTLTAHAVLVGEGTSPIATVGPGTSGIPLIGQGAADPAFGTAIVAGGGSGATSFTAHGVLVGEGTSPFGVTAVGATGIPLIGQTGADPVFGTAVVAGGGTGGTSYTPANALMLSGTTPTGALQASQNWQQSGSVTGLLLGNTNAAGIPNTIASTSGATMIMQSVDGAPNALIQISYAASDQNVSYRAENTGASPTATAANSPITRINARGFDGTGWVTSNMGSFSILTQNQTSTTDHSTQATLSLTPKGQNIIAVVATFQAATDGAHQLTGNISGVTVPSGNVGEYLSTVTLIGSEVSINSASNVASLNIPAGDWDVWGELWVDLQTGAATPSAAPNAALTSTSATLPTVPADNTARSKPGVTPTATGTTAAILPVGPIRVLQSLTVNFFLVGQQVVSAGTANGYGKICARRRQ